MEHFAGELSVVCDDCRGVNNIAPKYRRGALPEKPGMYTLT